jgi:hypothetical protein
MAAAMAALSLLSCSSEEKPVTDAGTPTPEETKKYFFGTIPSDNCYKGKQTLGSGTEATVSYEITVSIDQNTFLNRPTVRRTWLSGTGIELMEWFEVKGNNIYLIRYSYTEVSPNDHTVDFDPNVWYAKDPWKETDKALVTMVGNDKYEYSVLLDPVTVPAGKYDSALKVIESEAGRKGAYHFVPDTGLVQIQTSKHPKLGTMEVGLSTMADCQ